MDLQKNSLYFPYREVVITVHRRQQSLEAVTQEAVLIDISNAGT
jgi:hypothetical protein